MSLVLWLSPLNVSHSRSGSQVDPPPTGIRGIFLSGLHSVLSCSLLAGAPRLQMGRYQHLPFFIVPFKNDEL